MTYAFKSHEVVVTTLRQTSVSNLQRASNGVAVFHIPTGQQFSCEEHCSQYKNRAACLDMLDKYLQSLPSQQPTQDSYFSKLLKTVVDIDGDKCIMVPEEVKSEEDFIKWTDELD